MATSGVITYGGSWGLYCVVSSQVSTETPTTLQINYYGYWYVKYDINGWSGVRLIAGDSYGWQYDSGVFTTGYLGNKSNPANLWTSGYYSRVFNKGAAAATIGVWSYVEKAGGTNNPQTAQDYYTIPALKAPGAPTNVVATRNSDSQITLTWTNTAAAPATGATTIGPTSTNDVEVSAGGGVWVNIYNNGAAKTSHVHTGLAANNMYKYRVRSRNAAAASAYVESAIAYTSPATPTSLLITAQSAGSISLSWVDNSAYESGFQIEKNGSTSYIDVAANTMTWTDTSPLSETNTYRVRAAIGNVYSDWTPLVTSLAVPGSPGKPTLTRVSDTNTTVAWTASNPVPATYSVLRIRNSSLLPTIGILAGTTGLSMTDSTTIANSYYRYAISAINDRATTDSAVSDYFYTTPSALTSLTSSVDMNTKKVTLTWTDSAVSNNAGYSIERSTSKTSGFSEITTIAQNTKTWVDTNPIMGYSYYRIRSRALNGTTYLYSSYSTVLEVLTALPPNPATNVALSLSGTNFTATWVNGAITTERPRDSIAVTIHFSTGHDTFNSKTVNLPSTATSQGFTFSDFGITNTDGRYWYVSVIAVGPGENTIVDSPKYYGSIIANDTLVSLIRKSPITNNQNTTELSYIISNMSNDFVVDAIVYIGTANTIVGTNKNLSSQTTMIKSILHSKTVSTASSDGIPYSAICYVRIELSNPANSNKISSPIYMVPRAPEYVQSLVLRQTIDEDIGRFVCIAQWIPGDPTGTHYRIWTTGRSPDVLEEALSHPVLGPPPNDYVKYSFEESSGNTIKVYVQSYISVNNPGSDGGSYLLYSFTIQDIFRYTPDTLRPPVLLDCKLIGDTFEVEFEPPTGGLPYDSGQPGQYYEVDFFIDGIPHPLIPDTPANHKVASFDGDISKPISSVKRNFSFVNPAEAFLRAVSYDQNTKSIMSNALVIRYDVPDTGVYIYDCPHLLITRCQLNGPPVLANAKNSTVIMTDCVLGDGEYNVDSGSSIVEVNCLRKKEEG